MRIALVTESFYPAVDGTTTTVKAVADRLIDDGHEVTLLAPGPGLSSYRGSRVVRSRHRDPSGSQVREALADFAPDLVHVASPGPLGRKALKHAQRLGAATVVVEQSAVLDQTADYWRSKVAARADAVVVTSGWMVERAAELGVRADLWSPGVDTAAFAPHLRDPWLHRSWSRTRSRSGPLVVVGHLGGLGSKPDVRRLVGLAAVPGIRPVILGDGPHRGWLESRLPGARFTGALGPGDLSVALASLDLLVHPGEHETCAHALREAAASGVPVVAPRAGGARDVVRHLESGVLYDPADLRGLQRAVAAVVGDPRRARLGRRGRELAAGRSWADAVDELVRDHYARLVGRRVSVAA
jgi:phosphatidylinositol alpha 1,6-mannosyltransferase